MRTREQEARKAYEEAIAPVKKTYNEARNQAWKARDEAGAWARKEAEGQ